jgi:RNA polymerase sigma-70 factor (ECF subfamily)
MALVILRVLRRWGELSTALLDDLLQETYVALCANDYRLLRQFVERHPDSLGAMLRVVAANVTHDQIRARNSQKRGGNKAYADLQLIEGVTLDDETRRIEREVQLDEIDRLLQRAPKPISSERDREIFWLHFRAGMSAQAISKLPFVQLTAKGVETSLYRTIEFIRKGFKITPD